MGVDDLREHVGYLQYETNPVYADTDYDGAEDGDGYTGVEGRGSILHIDPNNVGTSDRNTVSTGAGMNPDVFIDITSRTGGFFICDQQIRMDALKVIPDNNPLIDSDLNTKPDLIDLSMYQNSFPNPIINYKGCINPVSHPHEWETLIFSAVLELAHITHNERG